MGDIFMVQVNCYWNRDDRYYKKGVERTQDLDGGTLFTQFSHFIDIMYWLFGDIANIQGNSMISHIKIVQILRIQVLCLLIL